MLFFNTSRIMRGVAAQGEIPPERTLLAATVQMAWPSILESFLIAFVGMVDTIMVGSLGAYAIAAVGLTTQPKFIGLAIFISLNVAVSAIVARRRGERDQDSANSIMIQAILLTLALTVVVTALCLIFADEILRFAGSSADTHGPAVSYFRIVMGGMAFNTISMVINAAQRGAGNTRIAMRTNLVSNLINVGLNYLLIGGNLGFPRLGMKGAAVATVVGTACACLMSIRSISHSGGFLYFQDFLHARFDRKVLKSLFSIGSSTFAEQIFMRIGFLVFAAVVARLGTTAFAAHQIGMNLLSLSFSFADGLSVAAVALVGRSLGERRQDLAKIYGSYCQRIGVLFSVGLSALCISNSRTFFLLFTEEEGVAAYAIMIMSAMSVITFLQITQVVYTGCLRAAGDTVYTAFVGFACVTIIRPLAGWALAYPLGFGLAGAWAGIVLDQTARLFLVFLRFHNGKWLYRRL